MNASSSIVAAPSAEAINALGNNIALVFAAAKESGQSEAVVREALALFNGVTVMPQANVSSYGQSDPALDDNSR